SHFTFFHHLNPNFKVLFFFLGCGLGFDRHEILPKMFLINLFPFCRAHLNGKLLFYGKFHCTRRTIQKNDSVLPHWPLRSMTFCCII
ncbi:unnamed protein product, partial [Prunus brigantina]